MIRTPRGRIFPMLSEIDQKRTNRYKNTGEKQKQREIQKRSEKAGRLQPTQSKRQVFQRRSLQLPPRRKQTLSRTTRSPSPASKSPTRNGGKNSSVDGSLRGSCSSGREFQKPCQKYLKETCKDPSCDHWHPPECEKYKSREGCSQSRKCSFLH